MRFYEINEAAVSRDEVKANTERLEVTKTIDYLKANCSDAFDAYAKGKAIYKGFSSDRERVTIVDASKIQRTSQNTNNIYTYFTSNVSQKWKAFPPRNRSLICSTHYGTAYNYARATGTVYVIFPFNGAKIGVCPTYDMWDSFGVTMNEDLNSFAEFMKGQCIRYMEMNGIKTFGAQAHWDLSNNAVEPYFPAFMKFPVSDFKVVTWENNAFHVSEYAERGYNVAQYMESILDPEANGFNVINTSQMSDLPSHSEVWVSGKCVVVAKSVFD